ncbi:MAG: type II toxin-antitoxin system CcdA family antitoxin [Candidatus Lokiarchaeota archaeon]|nr:type II toxin-antitoxin system CcdA family antitoxin [Candidatus Lokiarchaeota archaeon]
MESLYLKSYSYKSMKEYYELKKKLNLYIEEKTVIEAKELGLNISKVCENSLKLVIELMKYSIISKVKMVIILIIKKYMLILYLKNALNLFNNIKYILL